MSPNLFGDGSLLIFWVQSPTYSGTGFDDGGLLPSGALSLPYCITIARPLRNVRPPVCHTPYNISDNNIV